MGGKAFKRLPHSVIYVLMLLLKKAKGKNMICRGLILE